MNSSKLYFVLVCGMVTSLYSFPVLNTTNTTAPNIKYNVENSSDEGMNETQEEVYIPTSIIKNCSLSPTNVTLTASIRQVLKDGATMIEFKVKFRGKDFLPANLAGKKTSKMFKPFFWVRTTGRFGTRLLLLKPNYDVMSFKSLEIKVKKFKKIQLKENPPGCLDRLTYDDVEQIMRELVLNSFQSTATSKTEQVDPNDNVCNVRIRDIHGADFTYYCCKRDKDMKISCQYLESDIWFWLMTNAIRLIKLVFILFCPLLLPISMFRKSEEKESFVYKLENPFRISFELVKRRREDRRSRMMSSGQENDGTINLRLPQIKNMKNFKDLVQNLPTDKPIEHTITEAELQIEESRLVIPGEAPSHIFQTLYEFLVNCRIRELPSVEECCKADIFQKIPVIYTWYQFSRAFMTIVLGLVAITPWCIRMLVYYRYEHKEMTLRKEAAYEKGYYLRFQGNFALYLTPVHGIFIFVYVFLLVESFIFGNLSKKTKEKFQVIFRQCFLDMQATSRTKAFGSFVQLLLIPFTSLGCWVIFGGVFLWIILIPIALILMAFYMFPTINLTVRLFAHVVVYALPLSKLGWVHNTSGTDGPQSQALINTSANGSQQESSGWIHRVKNRLQPDNFELKDLVKQISFLRNEKALETCWGRFLQLLVIFFCMVTMYSTIFLLFEFVTFFLDVFMYTLIGFIIYADYTMTYISLAVLLLVYGKDCFGSVSIRYREYSATINKYIMVRCEAKALPVLYQNESDQVNTAFAVNLCETENDPCESDHRHLLDHRDACMVYDPVWSLAWEVNKVVFFLTKKDTPKIPTKLLFDASVMPYGNSPGRLLHQYLIAFMHFSWIVAFLIFVFLVVMTFGETGKISATNQLLATIAGGILPFLLRNFIFRPHTPQEIDPEKDINFKVAMHDLLNKFSQRWPIHDVNAIAANTDTDNTTQGTQIEDQHHEISNDNGLQGKLAPVMTNATDGVMAKLKIHIPESGVDKFDFPILFENLNHEKNDTKSSTK